MLAQAIKEVETHIDSLPWDWLVDTKDFGHGTLTRAMHTSAGCHLQTSQSRIWCVLVIGRVSIETSFRNSVF